METILTTPEFTYIALGLLLLFLIWVIRLEIKLKQFTRGNSGKSLEEILVKSLTEIENLTQHKNLLRQDLDTLTRKMKRAVQNVGVVRFNPFSDSGSNQSFATALIDEHGDGVVISTLYGRDRVGVYAKPIKAGKSEYELTDEEKMSVAEATKEK